MSVLAAALVTMTAAAPEVATVDLSGHSVPQLVRVLDEVHGQLDACRKAPPEPPRAAGDGRRPPKLRLPEVTRPLVSLTITPSGAVAHVLVEEGVHLDAACARRVFIRLEFGETTGTARLTHLKLPLRCDFTGCRYPWSAAP